ncbi:MAG: nucleotidyltransferase family protein [Bacteroidota bacterium]
MVKEAVILAGGLGTRLREVINEVPKSMAPVNGRPFLEYQMDYLHVYGIQRIILSVGYLREAIMKHFGNKYRDIHIDYAIEAEPMGTGGGLKLAMQQAEAANVPVLNGDTFFMVDFRKLLDFHRSKESVLTLVLREMEDVSRYGAIERDENYRITGFWEKSAKAGKGFINGGVYLINRNFFLKQNLPDKFSLEKDFFEKIYKIRNIYGTLCRQYFIDIGVPEDYAKAQHDFKEFGNF